MQGLCAAVIEDGIASGEFKPVDVPMLSTLPWVILNGVIVLASILDRDLVQPGQIIEETQQLAFEGLLTNLEEGAP
jgi:hypothetical protein